MGKIILGLEEIVKKQIQFHFFCLQINDCMLEKEERKFSRKRFWIKEIKKKPGLKLYKSIK